MHISSASSRSADPEQAVNEILAALPRGGADLSVIFLTSQHRGAAIRIADRLREALDTRAFVGCTCEGVIGPGDEIERVHGISVLTATLPSARAHPFHMMPSEWPALLATADALRGRMSIRDDTRALILLGDPFNTPAEALLHAVNTFAPGIPAFGGMASGASRPWDNALLMNDEIHTDGLVGFSLSGDIAVEAVVSQGCRPIGERMLVTAADRQFIQKLAGQNALQAIQNQIDSLSNEEQQLVENGLLLGVAISEYKEDFGKGDFLIRNLMGVDPNSGAIAVADVVRPGQSVQLHVRDAGTADVDLCQLLADRDGGQPTGALIFSCNGRGARMFDSPCHDIRRLQERIPGLPAAGFFAMGEIGPVAGRNCLHGHTASIALFSSP